MAATIANSGPEIGNRCDTIDAANRMVPPAESRCRYDAVSDSNFLRRKVEQFRLRKVVAATMPRPILIFFAAK